MLKWLFCVSIIFNLKISCNPTTIISNKAVKIARITSKAFQRPNFHIKCLKESDCSTSNHKSPISTAFKSGDKRLENIPWKESKETWVKKYIQSLKNSDHVASVTDIVNYISLQCKMRSIECSRSSKSTLLFHILPLIMQYHALGDFTTEAQLNIENHHSKSEAKIEAYHALGDFTTDAQLNIENQENHHSKSEAKVRKTSRDIRKEVRRQRYLQTIERKKARYKALELSRTAIDESVQIENLHHIVNQNWGCLRNDILFRISSENIITAMKYKSTGSFADSHTKEFYGLSDDKLPNECKGKILEHTRVKPFDFSGSDALNVFRVFYVEGQSVAGRIFCGIFQHPHPSESLEKLAKNHYTPCFKMIH